MKNHQTYSFSTTYYDRFNAIRLPKEMNLNSTPGPGFYNIPISSFDKKKSHSIQSRTNIDKKTDSSPLTYFNIDYNSLFTRRLPTSIGLKMKTDVFGFTQEENQTPETPAPSMPQPETLPRNPITIGLKTQISFNENLSPGPARYSTHITDPVKLVIPMKTSHSKREVSCFSPHSDIPGPGAYNPFPSAPKPKRWASKLRNIKPLPVAQLKRTIRQNEEKKKKLEEQKQRELDEEEARRLYEMMCQQIQEEEEDVE